MSFDPFDPLDYFLYEEFSDHGMKNLCERGATATEGEEMTQVEMTRAKTQRVRGWVSGLLCAFGRLRETARRV